MVTDAIEAEIEIPDADEADHIPNHALVRWVDLDHIDAPNLQLKQSAHHWAAATAEIVQQAEVFHARLAVIEANPTPSMTSGM